MNKIPVTKPFFTERENNMVAEALDSGWVAQGPLVAQFEKEVACHEGAAYGIATTSCTTALQLALTALGVGANHDVIVPSYTFVATANSVINVGARPVLADVVPFTFAIDPAFIEEIILTRYEQRNDVLTDKITKSILWGIIAVHQFGLCADMIKINAVAKKYRLQVLEDSACAIGAKIGDTHEGGFGNLSCLSFHPRKSITTGEGGMILTDDAALAERLRSLRSHGAAISADARHSGGGFLLPEYTESGFNYRMNDIQAAVGLAQMEKLDNILGTKIRLAKNYTRLISEKLPQLKIPTVPDGYTHTYQSYVVMLNYEAFNFSSVEQGGEYRDNILNLLEKDGIATRQGTHAVHLLKCYKDEYGFDANDFPQSYNCDRLSISLPLYVQMTEDEQEYVVERITYHLSKSL